MPTAAHGASARDPGISASTDATLSQTSPHAFCTPSLAEAASLGYSRESCAGWRGGARQPLQPGGDGGVQSDGEEHTQAAKARRVVHRVARDPHRARRAVLTATFRRRCRRLPPIGSQRAGRPPPLLRALRAPRSPTMRPEEMPSRAPAVAVTVVATTFAAAEMEPGSPRRSDPSPARGGCIDDGRARHWPSHRRSSRESAAARTSSPASGGMVLWKRQVKRMSCGSGRGKVLYTAYNIYVVCNSPFHDSVTRAGAGMQKRNMCSVCR